MSDGTPLHVALDGAKLVQAEEIGGRSVLQVWHGGTTVNVYGQRDASTLENLHCWSSADREGRPRDRGSIERRMAQHFEQLHEQREP